MAPLLPIAVCDPVLNAESVLLARECDTDEDLDPDAGGWKNESGSLRIRNGTCNGRLVSPGFRTESNRA